MPRHAPNPYASGFTIAELAMVMTIIAVVTAMGMSMGTAMLDSAQRANTEAKMDAIDNAMMAFRLANNRLPCPTDLTLTSSSAVYGTEAATPGTCTGGSPAANSSYTVTSDSHTSISTGTAVVEGGVPARTLNLPDEYMFDGWGRKIVYAVWAPQTQTAAYNNYGAMPNCGAVTVKDAALATRTSLADYALVSHGANGHGGYLRSGVRMSAQSTNAAEQTNCHCGADLSAAAYTATYVQKDIVQNAADSLDVFDDIVRFKERWQMQNTYDRYHPQGYSCAPGLRMDGEGENDTAYAMATGDINGDGFADLIIGARAAPGGVMRGYVYVVFGTAKGYPNPLMLASLDGTNGFRLEGVTNDDSVGSSLAVGDINGDGKGDIIIGAPGGNSYRGYTYVVFGKSSGWAATTSLATGPGNLIDGTQGFRLDGVTALDQAANVGSGDINGDGKDDILIGAHRANVALGYVYVVYGKSSGWAATATLATGVGNLIDGIQGFRLDSVTANEQAGYNVSAGDINGDSMQDLLIATMYPTGNIKGRMYVVFGKASGWAATTALTTGPGNLIDGVQGFRLDGGADWDRAGYSVRSGDINGDGIDDLIVNALASGGTWQGYTYVIFGKTVGWAATASLTTGPGNLIDGTQGFRLDGVGNNDFAGTAIDVADINGDGKDDLIIGAKNASASKGYTYVVFGKTSGWAATASLTAGAGNLIDGTQGFRLDGTINAAQIGFSVSAGDINGDGRSDVIIGAPGAAVHGTVAGAVYVYFGRTDGFSATTSLGSLCSTP